MPIAADAVRRGRAAAVDVLHGDDDRLLVVVGPCSIHDDDAAREYGARLAERAAAHADDLHVVMRTYFEKPRSTVGWKGLINDPGLDGTFDVARGLRTARALMLDLAGLGLPLGCEFLDPITPQYLADLVAWGSIGARTAASQVHRQLASGLSMPVGIKNGTDGDVGVAIDAIGAAAAPHAFMGVTPEGLAGLITTTGNPDAHLILRGGSPGTRTTTPPRWPTAVTRLRRRPDTPDASWSTPATATPARTTAASPASWPTSRGQVAAGGPVAGVMIESFLVEGRQDIGPDMVRGCSVTDACVGWDTTVDLLERARRAPPGSVDG